MATDEMDLSSVRQGLYEQLITVAIQQDRDRFADPRLYE